MSIGVLRGAGDARGHIDHRLARQHLINEYRRGRLRQDQVCDAHPELIRAATNVGTPIEQPCPICEGRELKLVTYVFGARLPAARSLRFHGEGAGRAQPPARRAQRYVVEACIDCHWHHLRKVLPVGGR